MEKEKYFKPSLEDLRIGSIVRTKDTSVTLDGVILRREHNKFSAYVEHTLNVTTFRIIFNYWEIWKDRIVVPYLTPEQIVAEGWTRMGYIVSMPDATKYPYSLQETHILKKSNMEICLDIFNNAPPSIRIIGYTNFRIHCPSINEFRLITKWITLF